MSVFIGLGNPGEKYVDTRHNAGFIFIDYLYETIGNFTEWKHDQYLQSTFAKSTDPKMDFILIKPQIFMNMSGFTVRAAIKRFNIQSDKDLYIVHDDLDIPLGKFKIQKGEGPKMHNGITSIEQSLRTKDFWRIRIGVDNRQGAKIPGEDYVLGDFHEEERTIIDEVNTKIYQSLLNK